MAAALNMRLGRTPETVFSPRAGNIRVSTRVLLTRLSSFNQDKKTGEVS